MEIKLTRDDQNDARTLGWMEYSGKRFATIERPWRDNARQESCIPVGRYRVAVTPSQRFGRQLPILINVPGRDGIRIHRANWVHELRGCIAPGRDRDDGSVWSSATAEMEITKDIAEAIADGQEVWITITGGAE